MRIFVTGGSGFIGSHLIKRLIEQGHEIMATEHETPLSSGVDFVVRCDLSKDHSHAPLKNAVRKFQPDIVYHLAAQPIVMSITSGVNELETIRINTLGTINILSACKDEKSIKSFVHISTDKVYGDTEVIDLGTPTNGRRHPYNASKEAGDIFSQMYSYCYDLPIVIIRNANVYGDGDRHFDRIVPRTILNLLRGQSPVIRGDGSNRRDYVHVSEIVDAYMKAAKIAKYGEPTVLNLHGYNRTIDQVVQTIQKALDVNINPIYEPQWKGEIPNQHIVDPMAYELIGWNPQVDFDLGISKTVPWYKVNYG